MSGEDLVREHGGKIAAFFVAIAFGLLRWFATREVKRLDQSLQAATEQLKHSVSREDMQKALNAMRDEMRDSSARVEAAVNRVHDRVDKLYERGA